MKMVKTVVSVLMLCVLTLSLAACGGSSSNALTEEEYVKKLTDLGTAMTEIQNSGANLSDPADAKKLLEDVKSKFVEAAEYNAPEKYKDAQAKIKSGSEAMVKFIDIGLKAMDGTEPSAEEQQKMMEYMTTALTDLSAGLSQIEA